MAAKRPIEIEKPFLTDEQWEKLSVHLPKPKPNRRGGQKPVDHRPVVEGLLWMLRNGSRWRDLPKYYPSASTCWRRLDEWEEKGVWVKIWHSFLGELNESGRLDWEEAFADASFAPAKKGATELEKPRKEKVQSGWWWSMVKEFRWRHFSKVPRQRK